MPAPTIPKALRCAAATLLSTAAIYSASPSKAANLLEPPVFPSANGVLDIMMIAQPMTIKVFDVAGFNPTGWVYTVCPRPASGTSCPAGAKTVSPYGGVRLSLNPGDLLKIFLVNNLPIVTETLTRVNDDPLLTLNPTNLHTHGLIVPAAANTVAPPAIPVYGDFVFTSVFNPANGKPINYNKDAYNTMLSHGDVVTGGVVSYNIQTTANHPSGSFWFHPHAHGISLNQLSAGLGGIITIGKSGDYACANEECTSPVPETMVRHINLKDMQVLPGSQAQFQEDPAFCANQPTGTPVANGRCAGDPGAYAGGYWFFTLNGQQYPTIPVSSANGEIWRFTNLSGGATYDLQLDDNRTGKPIAVQVLSIDGVSVSFPQGATAGQVVQVGKNRYKLASCGPVTQRYSSPPVCASDIIATPATRVEVFVAYRGSNGGIGAAPPGTTATLKTIGINTGPGGDSWPAINLAQVTFPHGEPDVITEAVHMNGQAATMQQTGGIFGTPAPGARPAPLPPGCQALAPGHHRRIYFANPNVSGGVSPGQDAYGNAIFGLGYEEIDQNGVSVPGTFVDVARYDPGSQVTTPSKNLAQILCLPLNPGQNPVVETWELVNLATELHNFHIHQTKFRLIDPAAPSTSPLYAKASKPGIMEDVAPLPFAVPGPGSQPDQHPSATSCLVSDYKNGKCKATPVMVQIPFARLGTFVFHCHILEHEDGGMMHAIRVVPSPS